MSTNFQILADGHPHITFATFLMHICKTSGIVDGVSRLNLWRLASPREQRVGDLPITISYTTASFRRVAKCSTGIQGGSPPHASATSRPSCITPQSLADARIAFLQNTLLILFFSAFQRLAIPITRLPLASMPVKCSCMSLTTA